MTDEEKFNCHCNEFFSYFKKNCDQAESDCCNEKLKISKKLRTVSKSYRTREIRYKKKSGTYFQKRFSSTYL